MYSSFYNDTRFAIIKLYSDHVMCINKVTRIEVTQDSLASYILDV